MEKQSELAKKVIKAVRVVDKLAAEFKKSTKKLQEIARELEEMRHGQEEDEHQ